MNQSDDIEPLPALPYQTPTDAPGMITVAVRLIALCVAAAGWERVLEILGAIASYYQNSGTYRGSSALAFLVGAVVVGAGYAVIAFVIWHYADRIARAAGRGLAIDSTLPGAPALLTVGLTVLGVYEIVEALPLLVRLVVQAATKVSYGYSADQGLAGWLSPLTRLAAGLYLVLGQAGIRQLIMRHSGRWRDDIAANERAGERPVL